MGRSPRWRVFFASCCRRMAAVTLWCWCSRRMNSSARRPCVCTTMSLWRVTWSPDFVSEVRRVPGVVPRCVDLFTTQARQISKASGDPSNIYSEIGQSRRSHGHADLVRTWRAVLFRQSAGIIGDRRALYAKRVRRLSGCIDPGQRQAAGGARLIRAKWRDAKSPRPCWRFLRDLDQSGVADCYPAASTAHRASDPRGTAKHDLADAPRHDADRRRLICHARS